MIYDEVIHRKMDKLCTVQIPDLRRVTYLSGGESIKYHTVPDVITSTNISVQPWERKWSVRSCAAMHYGIMRCVSRSNEPTRHWPASFCRNCTATKMLNCWKDVAWFGGLGFSTGYGAILEELSSMIPPRCNEVSSVVWVFTVLILKHRR
jgi:hypothetical protein